jgi:hypothetical protein
LVLTSSSAIVEVTNESLVKNIDKSHEPLLIHKIFPEKTEKVTPKYEEVLEMPQKHSIYEEVMKYLNNDRLKKLNKIFEDRMNEMTEGT